MLLHTPGEGVLIGITQAQLINSVKFITIASQRQSLGFKYPSRYHQIMVLPVSVVTEVTRRIHASKRCYLSCIASPPWAVARQILPVNDAVPVCQRRKHLRKMQKRSARARHALKGILLDNLLAPLICIASTIELGSSNLKCQPSHPTECESWSPRLDLRNHSG